MSEKTCPLCNNMPVGKCTHCGAGMAATESAELQAQCDELTQRMEELERQIDNQKYGWMPWGGGQAHGPFDSYELALANAQTYMGDEPEHITINEMMDVSGEDIACYLPRVDDLIYDASQQFDDTHGGGDDHMFERVGDMREAQEALEAALKEWGKEWVTTNCSWWLEEGEKITINSSGVVTDKSD